MRFSKITSALRRYAWDHDDRLPQKLSDVVPQYISLEQLSLFYPLEAPSATNSLPAGWNREPELINTSSDYVYVGSAGIPHEVIAYGRNKESSFAPFVVPIITPGGGGSHVTESEFDQLFQTNNSAVLDRLRKQRVVYYEVDLQASFKDYRHEFGSYARGDNASITRILRGENPMKKQFHWSYAHERNERGEELDPWGTPYMIESDGERVRIKSAGSNQKFDQPDSPSYDDICRYL